MLVSDADSDELNHSWKPQLAQDLGFLIEQLDISLVPEALPIDDFYSNGAASIFAFANLGEET